MRLFGGYGPVPNIVGYIGDTSTLGCGFEIEPAIPADCLLECSLDGLPLEAVERTVPRDLQNQAPSKFPLVAADLMFFEPDAHPMESGLAELKTRTAPVRQSLRIEKQGARSYYVPDLDNEYPNLGRPDKQSFAEICCHPGLCDGRCPCVRNQAPCRAFCSCGIDCPRQFPRCDCTGPCGDDCNCVLYQWACIPGGCTCTDCPHVFDLGILPMLAVWESSIPNAGRGLFAMEDLREGTFLGDYTGNVVSEQQDLRKHTNRVSLFTTSKGKRVFASFSSRADTVSGWAIDGDSGDSLLLYMNHGNQPNVRFAVLERPQGRFPVGVTLRPVKAGEELLVLYGWVYLCK